MGQPDGGWYDETPPTITYCSPKDKATDVKTRKINIVFDEYIQVDNPTEKVVVSPPQLETPEIKAAGKKIIVELKDTLKASTTYTVDFSDAISDNNEGNPLGNFTYTFSTGNQIDTLEVSGHVIDASNLEPIKGILVGLYSNLCDTAFTSLPMLRVSRTDSRGKFVIRGIAPGNYRIYALDDADGNYTYNQKSERLAFCNDIIKPSAGPAIRQDTIWKDSLHIDSIVRVGYTRFTPDNILLRAFTAPQTDRYLIKTDRQQSDHFSLYFSYGNGDLPELRGLNFSIADNIITEASERADTVTYWLRDTALVNMDTLRVEVSYLGTDTTGVLSQQTDTLEILAKEPYAKRLKRLAREREEWQKQQDKAKKRGKEYQTEMPIPPLDIRFDIKSEPAPDQNIFITMPSPPLNVDTARIHLYAKHDTLWYRAPFMLQKKVSSGRIYEFIGEWRPGIEYSLEVDTMAFTDIYGKTSAPVKRGFRVKTDDAFATILFDLSDVADSTIVVQLLDSSDKVVKQTSANKGTAEFFYILPGTYYARLFYDTNNNGMWDTGEYNSLTQPEKTCYYPNKIECKALRDYTISWHPDALPGERQKPMAITKQKPDAEKTIKNRNAERAKNKK
ncbi:MAG: Ig-like domain-containing protein [Prevotella sp.]